VVATSVMVLEAIKAADVLGAEGIELEIIDPVCLQPFDEQTVINSVQKTGHLICAESSWRRCGFASEVAATVAEKAFDALKSPIRRITWPDCPCPVSKPLEDFFYPTYHDIIKNAFELLNREVSYSAQKVQEVDTFMGPY